MNSFIIFLMCSVVAFLILDFIDFFQHGNKISVKKYINLITCILLFDIIAFIGDSLGMNISSEYTQGIKFGCSILLFMILICSAGNFIAGVIQLIKNNDYKKIKDSALFLGIFFIMYISFKLMGIF